MTKAEKRNFKLATNKTAGNKDYIRLFDLIDNSPDNITGEQIEKKLSHKYSDISKDNVSRYLVKLIVDNLVAAKANDDLFSKILYNFIKINILIDRNLIKSAIRELKSLEDLANKTQNHLMFYLCTRYKINFLIKDDFKGTSEEELVNLQMKAKESLRSVLQVQEHSTLYELLKFRLIYTGKPVTEKERQHLNDLVLHEMSLVSTRNKNNIESQKLHLLFQSFFFTDVGDYKSASRTFYELNALLERNIDSQNPPTNYLSALDGILDSLRTIKDFHKMLFYIEKLNRLYESDLPENFKSSVKKSIIIYTLAYYMGKGAMDEALQTIESEDTKALFAFPLIDEEKHTELFFYLSVVNFIARNYKKASKYINEIVLIGKSASQSLIYRASRLLNILILYEYSGNEIESQIRAFKRTFKNNKSVLQTEKLLFKVLNYSPKRNIKYKNEMFWSRIEPTIQKISIDKYEQQLLKYFDFTDWIKMQFKKEMYKI